MGGCSSNQNWGQENSDVSEKVRTKLIEALAKRQCKGEFSTNKFLLLGTSDSGKSTLFNQARLIYGKRFSKKELKLFKCIILLNVIEGMKTLVNFSNKDNLKVKQSSFEFFKRYQIPRSPKRIKKHVVSHIEALWSDSEVQRIFKNRARLKLTISDNVPYYYERIRMIARKSYIPETQDILCCRSKTSNAVEMDLQIAGNSISLIDVGGKRDDRKKWIHHFERCRAILFVAAVSEFDQVLEEDTETNRLIESLDLFGEICDLVFLQRVTMILFLNKHDLFIEKVESGIDPRVVCPLFANYVGSADSDGYLKHIIRLFAEKNVDESRSIYCHVSSATKSELIDRVFSKVFDVIFQERMDDMM